MPDIIHVTYAQTGASSQTNALGMRDKQAKAYQARHAQYLLLKSPPASGKSRALMFIGLDKLIHQGIKKVIVAVPERIDEAIGLIISGEIINYRYLDDSEEIVKR